MQSLSTGQLCASKAYLPGTWFKAHEWLGRIKMWYLASDPCWCAPAHLHDLGARDEHGFQCLLGALPRQKFTVTSQVQALQHSQQ